MVGLGALIAMVLVYFIVGPLVGVIGARVFLWLGRSFNLPDALGSFSAEVVRAFRAEMKFLDREMGGHP